MEKQEFFEKLIDKTKKINCKLNDNQLEQFYTYMDLLLEWNNKINLTAITEPEEVITKHFLDSLTILKYIKDNTQIADIGTGAGFPGLPLKIANPSLSVTLVDSLNKRINFLNEVIEQIGIDHIKTIHNRAEDFGQNKEYREMFDVAVSRAVARLNVLVEYLLPAVKVGGICICMKGPDAQEEIDEAENAIKLLGGRIADIFEFVLPDTDLNRTIIIIEKVKNTPNKFPRKSGMPSKNPLK